MKKHCFTIFLFTCMGCNAQTAPNYAFFKLFVTNEQNEVMLVKWEDSWEIPGQKYVGSKTVTEFVRIMGENHGISVGTTRLNAVVTFHYDNTANPTLMQYYTANYINGELKIPPSCSDIKWVSMKEAFDLIPYGEMVQIMEKINLDKNRLWGAAYNIQRKTDKTPRNFSIRENFYTLN